MAWGALSPSYARLRLRLHGVKHDTPAPMAGLPLSSRFGGMVALDGGLGGMEENKKSGGGDVRAFALSWDGEWDKT